MHFDFTPFLSRSPVELLPNRHANNGKGDCLPSSNGPQLNSYYSQAGRASLSPSQKETPRLRELIDLFKATGLVSSLVRIPEHPSDSSDIL